MSLVPATLIKRYKRFLADVRLDDGRECTVHCPNPGAMTGVAEAGMRVYLREVQNPKAKLPYRWVMTRIASTLIGVDPLRANAILTEALQQGTVPALRAWSKITAEVQVDTGTRLDFCLENADEKFFLEVKSATLSQEGGVASFPDTPTARGRKHLETLIRLRNQGYQAGLFFVVQRTDCEAFTLAERIDGEYAVLCHQAIAAGVEVHAWDCTMDFREDKIALRRALGWQGGRGLVGER